MSETMNLSRHGTVVIQSRFNGPPTSGNGGYVCGLLARGIDSGLAVTLRSPPPLDTPLQLIEAEPGFRKLYEGDQLIAETAPAEVALEVPPMPDGTTVERAERGFRGFHQHSFPGCFVCGPERAVGDGLRIFAGPVDGQSLVASSWQPSEELADAQGNVRSEFVWAALDCPGAFALGEQRPSAPMLLGRLQARLHRPLPVGQRYHVIGWPLGSEGRKHRAGTAVYAEDGSLTAEASAIWIELAPK